VPVAYDEAVDFSEGELYDRFPHLRNLTGAKVISRAFAEIFVGQAVARAHDLRLTTPSFRAAAGTVAAEMAIHDAAHEGADLLERLAAAGAAVEPTLPARSVA